MKNLALARKWRPKNFETIVGQEFIVEALKNSILGDRLHHAYLLSGTRGVGKTTIARIFAKCLNCHTGSNPTPCCECSSCVEIDQSKVEGTSILDVVPVEAGDGPVAVMTGGLALALPEIARSIEWVLDSGLPLVLDVNCRPALIDDRSAFLDRVRRFAAGSDLVKVSDEDARWLAGATIPTADAVEQIVDELLALGTRAVVVTAGADPVLVATASGRARVEVPAVEVVDTIGAGDAFDAGVIAYWIRAGADHEALGQLDLLTRAVGAGVAVSAVVCGRRGADPPQLGQLPAELWP